MTRLQNNFIFVFLGLVLCACAAGRDPLIVYQGLNKSIPTIENFPHCHGYGCRIIDDVALSKEDIRTIKVYFTRVHSAEEEREAIRRAIAQFETLVGEKAGTKSDVKGTYIKLGDDQLDCVDESINTTTYLLLLHQADLLKFHRVLHPTSRLPIFSGRLGPHRTALILDTETQIKYAVDSWFHDNGVKPEIVPLDDWQFGWSPA